MKRIHILALTLLLVSCAKTDLITEVQTVSFPSAEEEGVITTNTLFNMKYLDATIDMSLCKTTNNEYLAAFSKIEEISNKNENCKVFVYSGTVPSGAETLIPNGNISVFLDPDVTALSAVSKSAGHDLYPYSGYRLLAVSDVGGIYVIPGFLNGDVLGTLNGLVSWINGYNEQKDKIQDAETSNAGIPEATKLFNSYQCGTSIIFELRDKVVASVTCSKKDKQSGQGTYDIRYSVLPLHAFDDQPGTGDYYYVKGTFTLNASGMYKGNYTSRHGGVIARICAFFADKYQFRSFITDKNGKVVGHFVDRGTPMPGTTIGSTTFTSGMSWSITGGLTGGIQSGNPTGGISLSGGISVTNSESRQISDFECRLDAANSTAKYVNDYMNLPFYENLQIKVPSTTCISSVSFDFAYIVKVDNVKDFSTETFNINFCLDSLVFDHCRFYSSRADMEWFEWKIKDMINPDEKIKVVNPHLVWPIKGVNRIPTGKLKIYHDTDSFGKYIYSVTASQEGRTDPIVFNNKTFDVGGTFREYIPTGNWLIRMKVGTSADNVQEIVAIDSVRITRADSTQIITGANFKRQ